MASLSILAAELWSHRLEIGAALLILAAIAFVVKVTVIENRRSGGPDP